MCDEHIHQGLTYDPTISRRTFSLGAAATAVLSSAAAHAQSQVVEKDVNVPMASGVSDSVLFYPAGKGPWPAVLTQDAAFSDAKDYIAFLDKQPQTDLKHKAGVQGYCMGGPLTFRTAAIVPNRIGAAATFHGGGLVTDKPDSPHLLIPKMKATVYCAVADNDDKSQPTAKDTLKASFAAAKVPAKVEVYTGDNHGWCVKGSQPYDEAGAERAWAELTALYKKSLA